MAKNMMIAGKNFPDVVEFAESLSLSGNGVCVAASPVENTGLSSKEIGVLSWNKGSALAARSVVIQAETRLGSIDDYILYFDTASFSKEFDSLRPDVCSQATDSMTLGYQYLTMEILSRIQQKKKDSKLIFVLKTCPSEKDAILNPSVRNSSPAVCNPIVAAAEASFATFAETIAAMYGEKENISVLLITGDENNEVIQKDNGFASWLIGYLEAYKQLKHKPNIKNTVSWIRAGAKNPGGFSLFK